MYVFVYASQDLSRTYLAHHELESVVTITTIIIVVVIIITIIIIVIIVVVVITTIIIIIIDCVYVYYCSGQQLHSSGKRGQAYGQHLPASAACAAESSSYATGAPCSVEDKPCGRHGASHMVCTNAISAGNFGQTAREFDQITRKFD